MQSFLEEAGLVASVLQAHPLAFLIADVDGMVVWANSVLMDLTGYTAGDLVGHSASLLGCGTGDRSFGSLIQDVLHFDRAWKGEVLCRAKSGSPFIAEQTISPVKYVKDEKVTRLVLTTWVITKSEPTRRKELEEALYENEQKLAVIFNAPFAIALARLPDGVIVDVNDAWVEIYGYTREEVLGKTSVELNINRDPQRRALLFAQIQERGSMRGLEYSLFTKSGAKLVVSCNIDVVPLRGEKYLLTVMQDITSRKTGEEALQRAQSELAHVTRILTLGELTTSIAHELNQPLTALVANATACQNWLQLKRPDLDEIRLAVGDIVSEALRASHVVERIRSLMGRTAPKREVLNINEVIRQVVAFTTLQLSANRVTLQTELQDDISSVSGDGVQLQQVLLNLILNSNDALKEVESRTRKLIIRSQESMPGEVMVTVQDSGKGLGSLDAKRLFDPFFSTKEGGLGLGLSISRTIIESHFGRLWATRNTSEGASFHFTLPSINTSNAGSS